MAGSALAATPRDQTSGGGAKYGKVAEGVYFRVRSQTIGVISLVFAQSTERAQSGHINPATPVEKTTVQRKVLRYAVVCAGRVL